MLSGSRGNSFSCLDYYEVGVNCFSCGTSAQMVARSFVAILAQAGELRFVRSACARGVSAATPSSAVGCGPQSPKEKDMSRSRCSSPASKTHTHTHTHTHTRIVAQVSSFRKSGVQQKGCLFGGFCIERGPKFYGLLASKRPEPVPKQSQKGGLLRNQPFWVCFGAGSGRFDAQQP